MSERKKNVVRFVEFGNPQNVAAEKYAELIWQSRAKISDRD
jgi:hypothetical protein